MTGWLQEKIYKTGKTRDGFPTHASGSCEHHGGCPICEENRLVKFRDKEEDYEISNAREG